ncbi:hypothetical protein [endosymbiont 'TC1' of Trimyema compressum]|uniref:hypothetical protein n=1 Tax=endosymbiont 'TC1' of Trimyema compressum TaxID=243899 RepID=UPI0013923367|nr:hypothetical protein [endosymbiont 'TC1' of Trimyema compressum]
MLIKGVDDLTTLEDAVAIVYQKNLISGILKKNLGVLIMDEKVESELSIEKLYHQLALGFQKSPLTIGVGEIISF